MTITQNGRNINLATNANKSTNIKQSINYYPAINKHKPENLHDAGKISGITPSALFQIVKHKKTKGNKVA